MKMMDFSSRLMTFSLVMLLLGCSSARLMMPTPNVHLIEAYDPYQNLNPELKSSEVNIFYITDRMPEKNDKGLLHYGYNRSVSLAFGTAVVDLGVDMTWEELLQASRTQQRSQPVKMAMGQVTEYVRGPRTPIPYAQVNGKIVEMPTMLAEREQAAQAFRAMIVQQLSLTPRKEVFIYVHGFHNDFDDAIFAMAELWHFLGRIGVPIVYTWPAGHPGIYGYSYDRESSEFTVYHLREVLGFIDSFPEVEKVHIIAHSRGTDIAVAALRELTLSSRAAGIDPKLRFRIHNFVLAAPDHDVMVAIQRIDGDKLPLSVNRFTIYTSPDDRAIGITKIFFQSPKGRIGNFRTEDITNYQRHGMEFYNAPDFAIVQFLEASDGIGSQGDSYGHSYFRNAPAVSSNLLLMLRDDIDPGTPGRPLEHIDYNYWSIPADYHGEPSNE
jgi:esterase/lipase superfamily enzyme